MITIWLLFVALPTFVSAALTAASCTGVVTGATLTCPGRCEASLRNSSLFYVARATTNAKALRALARNGHAIVAGRCEDLRHLESAINYLPIFAIEDCPDTIRLDTTRASPPRLHVEQSLSEAQLQCLVHRLGCDVAAPGEIVHRTCVAAIAQLMNRNVRVEGMRRKSFETHRHFVRRNRLRVELAYRSLRLANACNHNDISALVLAVLYTTSDRDLNLAPHPHSPQLMSGVSCKLPQRRVVSALVLAVVALLWLRHADRIAALFARIPCTMRSLRGQAADFSKIL